MEQRLILNNIAPDFKRENQTQTDFLRGKHKQIVDFIKDYMMSSRAQGIIVGISGGIDSFLVGALCAEAVSALNAALRLVILPNGKQADYADAVECINVIKNVFPALQCETVSIENGFNGVVKDLKSSSFFIDDSYTIGNLQPRLRMMYQYALGKNLLVAGTDHCAEAMTGFFTKYGDGGTDINPIQDLIKDDIYEMSKLYSAPKAVITKKPAAGIGISGDDESELGITYKDMCAYLRGEILSAEINNKIETIYTRTAHKRETPASPKSLYWVKKNRAIIVIDFINAFIDGTLPCENAQNAVHNSVNLINSLPDAMVLYVCDSHPKNHISFKQQGGEWPEHAVTGTSDASISPLFYNVVKKSINTPRSNYNVFLKGQHQDAEQYSGIDAVNFAYGTLKENIPNDVTVVGAATEYCVKATVLDLLALGFNVTIPENCLAYVDKNSHETALKQMLSQGADLVVSNH